MKHLTLLLSFVIALGSFSLSAQDKDKEAREKRMQEYQQKRLEYLKKQVEMTPAESNAFWPLYEEYRQKLRDLRKESTGHRPQKGNPFEGMSPAEIEQHIQKGFSSREQKINMQRDYHQKFTAVLPVEKVARVYWAEKEFLREMYKQRKARKDKKK